MNDKIIDLSFAADENVEMIREAIEKWREEGMFGNINFCTEEDIDRKCELIATIATTAAKKGANTALTGVVIGAAVMAGIGILEWRIRRKNKTE